MKPFNLTQIKSLIATEGLPGRIEGSQWLMTKSEFVRTYDVSERSVERYLKLGLPHKRTKSGETALVMPFAWKWVERRQLATSIFDGGRGGTRDHCLVMARAIQFEVSGCLDDGTPIAVGF